MNDYNQDPAKKEYVKPEILEVLDLEDLDVDVSNSSLEVYAYNWY
jgi:hypothetical protein